MNIERECHENLFLKVEVTLSTFNLHLQYYKIDLRFTIKLQIINFNLYEEHKNRARRATIVLRTLGALKLVYS